MKKSLVLVSLLLLSVVVSCAPSPLLGYEHKSPYWAGEDGVEGVVKYEVWEISSNRKMILDGWEKVRVSVGGRVSVKTNNLRIEDESGREIDPYTTLLTGDMEYFLIVGEKESSITFYNDGSGSKYPTINLVYFRREPTPTPLPTPTGSLR